MASLQDFLRQRQHNVQDAQRQEIQKNFKVPVPGVKLEHRKSPSLIIKPAQAIDGDQSTTQEGPRNGQQLKVDQISNYQGDGFDTDAEGLDDTTIGSSIDDRASGQPTLSGPKNAFPKAIEIDDSDEDGSTSTNSIREGHSRNRQQNQHDAESVAIGGDSDGYEESGEEDGEGYGAHYDRDLIEEVTGAVNSPGYIRFRREEALLPETQSLTQAIQSGDIRARGVENAGIQIPWVTNISSRPLLNTEGRPKDNKVDRTLAYQPRPSAVPRYLPSSNSQLRQDGLMKPRGNSDVPLIVQPTATPEQPPFTTPRKSKSQALEPQKQEAPVPKDYGGIGVTGNRRGKDLNSDAPAIPPTNGNAGVAKAHKHADSEKESQSKLGNNSPDNDHIHPNEYAGTNAGEPTPEANDAAKSVKPKASDTSQKRSRELDYNSDQLASMSFQQLKDEPFHIDPKAPGFPLPPEASNGTLVGKLDFLLKVDDQTERNSLQNSFLKSLPIDEYEQCGDIIVEKFSDLVKKFKDAKQERRRAAKDFEDEVARREESVREKINAFEMDFSRLKQDGEDVVRKRLAM